jgi:hypothetical protein
VSQARVDAFKINGGKAFSAWHTAGQIGRAREQLIQGGVGTHILTIQHANNTGQELMDCMSELSHSVHPPTVVSVHGKTTELKWIGD